MCLCSAHSYVVRGLCKNYVNKYENSASISHLKNALATYSLSVIPARVGSLTEILHSVFALFFTDRRRGRIDNRLQHNAFNFQYCTTV